MKNLLLAMLFLAFPFATIAQSNWTVKSSEITFKIKNAGFTVDGSFKGFNAEIAFESSKLPESNIQATIDTKTISTGIGLRDNHLRKEEYFGVEKYPKITMKSVKFTSKGGNNYTGTFQLTIKSVTKTIDIPFTFTENTTAGIFKGSFTINRRDYTIGGNSWTMADDVTISLTVNAAKSATSAVK